MANMSLKKVAMPEQDPNVRNKNFDEVALGYTKEMAMEVIGNGARYAKATASIGSRKRRDGYAVVVMATTVNAIQKTMSASPYTREIPKITPINAKNTLRTKAAMKTATIPATATTPATMKTAATPATRIPMSASTSTST